MATQTADLSEPRTSARMSTIHALLTVQSVVVMLVSINRLSTLTLGYVAPNEFLRWVDLNNMLVLPLISLVAFYLLKKETQKAPIAGAWRWNLALNLAFIVGLYLLGASYGDHEVTNYLHSRYCPPEETSRLCDIIIYNDDEFSHYVFFTGFVMVNAALMLIQVLFPHAERLSSRDKVLLAVNALFMAAGIVANLAFEEIGLDLYVILLLAAISLGMLWRKGAQPLLVYYSTAYTVGLVVTAVVKLARG